MSSGKSSDDKSELFLGSLNLMHRASTPYIFNWDFHASDKILFIDLSTSSGESNQYSSSNGLISDSITSLNQLWDHYFPYYLEV